MIMQFAKNAVVSRTYYVCIAQGLRFDGFDNGRPQMGVVESESYLTTNPNDKAAAKRMVKRADKDVIVDTITVEVVASEVVAMSNEDFISNGMVVDRAANGRIK